MKYGLIYAGPPWQYGNTISRGAAGNHYDTMTITDLKRLPVWELSADNAVLVMWYTGTHEQEARELAEAWGFDVKIKRMIVEWGDVTGHGKVEIFLMQYDKMPIV